MQYISIILQCVTKPAIFQVFVLARICLLVCSLFNDAVCNSGYIPMLIRGVTHLKASIKHFLAYC